MHTPTPILLGLLVACSGDKDDSESVDMTLATYNVGLAAGFVPYTPERAPEVYSALGALEVDAVCLQEVWTAEDRDAILAATETNLPHSYYEVTTEGEGTDEPACTTEESDPLLACALANCEGSDDLTNCVFEFCGAEFEALSDTCAGCAAANVGLNDVTAIVEVCTSGSGTFSWGGHNGLLLLSAREMSATESLKMESWLVQRNVIYAEIDGVSVGCTHLAADLSSLDYGGATYASYAEENAAQVTESLAWLDEKAGGNGRVLLGDLNTGPTLPPDITGELEDNWGLIASAGWLDANVAADAPFCTWCAENTLTGDVSSKAIDHILVAGGSTTDAVRIFDGTVSITADEGTVDVPLSDHYGWQAAVTVTVAAE